MTSRWPLLIPVFALVVIGILAMAQPEPPPDREQEERAEAPTPAPPPRKRPEPTAERRTREPADYTEADLPDYVRKGPGGKSAWQRRLSAGFLFKRLRHDLDKRRITPRSVAASLLHLEKHLLALEGTPELLVRLRAMRPGSARSPLLRDLLDVLTTPALDPLTLRFFADGTSEDSRLGTDQLVRVWSKDRTGIPLRAIGTGAALVRRLDTLAGVSLEAGYDVLHDPTCGREVFPLLRVPGSWIGVYLPRDAFCMIDSTLDPERWSLTLRHELVHAWEFAHCDSWTTRFLTEGIAEYLKHVRPGDATLEVPLDRLRDNFALLVRMVDGLERLGGDMARFDLQRLLNAEPWEFYVLGYFSYLVAQATVAYVDVETLERSLWSRSDAPLRAAVRALEWETLMAWVRDQARAGAPGRAFVVGDGQPDPELDADVTEKPKLAHRVLERMGVVVSPSAAVDGLELGDDDLIENYEHVSRIIEEVFARERKEPLTVICDVTRAMDVRRDRMVPFPKATGRIRMIRMQRPHTPRLYVKLLLRTSLRRTRSAGVHLMAASDVVEAASQSLPRIDSALRPAAIPLHLRHGGSPSGPVVVLTATEADASEREGTRIGALATAMDDLPEGLGPVLVVDLGARPGYGRDLAHAIHRAGRSAGIRVAYWHAAEAK